MEVEWKLIQSKEVPMVTKRRMFSKSFKAKVALAAIRRQVRHAYEPGLGVASEVLDRVAELFEDGRSRKGG